MMRRFLVLAVITLMAACGEPPAGNDGGTGGGTGGSGGGSTGGGTGGGSTGGGTGGGSADTTPPSVLGTVPADAAMTAAVGSSLQITFSEAMTQSSVTVSSSPSVAFGAPIWAAGNTQVSYTPTAAFAFDTSYTITVNGSDAAGNAMTPAFTFTFKTEAAPDTTPPTVTNTQPDNAATMVSPNTPIAITFSEAMSIGGVTVTASPAAVFGTPTWTNGNAEVTVTPTAPLATNTAYTITVTGSDVAGNAMAAAYTFGFTTAPPPDTTPPTVASSIPANSATNVTATTRLSLTFSEPMNTPAVTVATSPMIDLGTATWSNGDMTVTFLAPMSDWANSTVYTVTTNGTDVAGNTMVEDTRTFTTAAPPDTTPPVVQSTAPAGGATNVAVNTNIEFNFSEPMNQAATEAAFSATPAITNCAFTWNTARTLMSCNPGTDLSFSTNYTIRLGTGATDDAGNGLAAQFTAAFGTASAPDTTRPTVTATAPVNAAIGAAINTTITVTFSEPMRQSATQSAFQITSPAGFNGGTFTWLSPTVMRYTPPASFAYGQTVVFQVTTAAEDLAGNTMAATQTRSFRVRRRTTSNFYASGASNPGTTDLRDGYIYGTTTCSTAVLGAGSAAAYGGDRYSTAAPTRTAFRGYMTFNIATLVPLQNLILRSASLNVRQIACGGNPFTAAFGSSIEAWHADYGPSLDLGDCNPTDLGRHYTLSTAVGNNVAKTVADVRASISNDITNAVARGNRTQFLIRSRTLSASDGDTTSDYCYYGTYNYSGTASDPYLRVDYEYD